MLIVEISKIPPEGLSLDSELTPGEVHVEGEETFELLPGGRLEARAEKGDENSVHVRGHLSARLQLQCGRCLDAFVFPLEQDLDLFYLPQSSAPRPEEEEEEEVELADRDMVVAFYRGDRLDVGDMVREQLFLTIPMKRLCREDCGGLCPSCGANRNLTPCECTAEDLDPRLAPLKDLFGKGSS
ncbi:MAG TPA: DUF177 domain-containing protein [Vicinamibacteria bacterium]|jgi:uncharacterized protein